MRTLGFLEALERDGPSSGRRGVVLQLVADLISFRPVALALTLLVPSLGPFP